jgi:hypothetical protein
VNSVITTEVLETGLTYDGIAPVRVHVTRREGRYEFSDGGGAVAAAGVRPARLRFDERIDLGAYEVNMSRNGVVSLPGFASSSDEWLARLPELVAEGSLVLYEALLELDDVLPAEVDSGYYDPPPGVSITRGSGGPPARRYSDTPEWPRGCKMDNVGIVVESLDAAISFFAELGLSGDAASA